MTQYLLSVHNDPAQDFDSIPPEDVQRMYKSVEECNQEMKAAGAWVFGGGLHPPTSATTVRIKDDQALITDGPYAETKEYLGGFWILEAADLDAALAWAEKASRACEGPVEVRPFQDDSG